MPRSCCDKGLISVGTGHRLSFQRHSEGVEPVRDESRSGRPAENKASLPRGVALILHLEISRTMVFA